VRLKPFARYAWGVLAVNVLVILWGAYVRATGSGAGCGSHWPTCNGEIIPRALHIETLIEFTHRLSSGLALLLVVGLLIWAWRGFGKGHPVRLGGILAMVFIITEALVGAALVLFEWVAKDESLGRVIFIAIHLVNTFLLLASLTLTAWWASGGHKLRLKSQGVLRWAFGVGFLGVIFLGISGAITALGDTLFPVATLNEGLLQDISSTAHFTIRLRVWHLVIAILVGFYLTFLALWQFSSRKEPAIRRLSILLGSMFFFQLTAGLVNLLLLAPVAMQLIHLFLADMVWVMLVLLFAATFQEESQLSTVE